MAPYYLLSSLGVGVVSESRCLFSVVVPMVTSPKAFSSPLGATRYDNQQFHDQAPTLESEHSWPTLPNCEPSNVPCTKCAVLHLSTLPRPFLVVTMTRLLNWTVKLKTQYPTRCVHSFAFPYRRCPPFTPTGCAACTMHVQLL